MLSKLFRLYTFSIFSTNMVNVSISPIMTGRWKRENQKHLVYIKVDQANEDHCGCCFPIKKNKFTEIEKNELVYYCM